MIRFSSTVIRSMMPTARVRPSSSNPALMPRIRSGQASSPPASSVPPTFCAMDSLIRARFTMHSRSTAACTCTNSSARRPLSGVSSVAATSAAWPASRRRGTIRRSRLPSRRSSTLISVVAMSISSDSVGETRCSAISLSRSVSVCTLARRSPRPSTPSVSPILRKSSTCGASSPGWPLPRRIKISSVSLTLPRSSRIAAATVCINLMLGADKVSRSSSTARSTGRSSSRRKEPRTAETLGPWLCERAM